MTNAASTSNPSVTVNVNEANQNLSHVIGINFVTVKLSDKNQYNLWRIQMECLLKSQHMVDFIKGAENGKGKGKEGDMEAWVVSDSLVKGWILGSLSEEAARKAVNRLIHMRKNPDFTAKDLWDELQRTYDPLFREQAQGTQLTPTQLESAKVTMYKKIMYDAIPHEDTKVVVNMLEKVGLAPSDKLRNNGNTTLHEAVASSSKNHKLLKTLLEMTPIEKTILDLVNSDGSSLLHAAAIGGNIKAVNMLVERSQKLLLAKDKEGRIPLALSISNMQTKTSKCLFKHMQGRGDCRSYFSGESGEEIVVLAISCQDFCLANKIINEYPDAILSDSDRVLTALAQNFPRELNSLERGFSQEFNLRVGPLVPMSRRLRVFVDESGKCVRPLWLLPFALYLFTLGLYVLATLFYQFLKVLVRPFVEDTFQIYNDAFKLLQDVCALKIKRDNSRNTNPEFYINSIFEGTSKNTSTFVRYVILLFPDAILSTNEDGYNFIQYSVITRSEKIYSLTYEMRGNKNIYKTITDYYGNNLLHLVARLAPTNKLKLISGAALQVQRELQWFKEVEQFLCPLNRTQKNLDDETPQEVFTREHKDLVIEGEKWIKKTAESYTITAALIITIVFAAAITVPGGNNQESGIPVFTNEFAFTVFAISDAISLFSAVTSLLMFLSILTTRFAEQDFLFKLPTKLIIGLIMLFLSTTAMIIAFGATLFLVFGQRNLMVLISIGALTCLPITSFVTLQCPLIFELISATYGGGIFVREVYVYMD